MEPGNLQAGGDEVHARALVPEDAHDVADACEHVLAGAVGVRRRREAALHGAVDVLGVDDGLVRAAHRGVSPQHIDDGLQHVHLELLLVLELAHIACNKNTVPGDKSAMVPGGLRLGTPALTTRGFVEADFVKVADLVVKGIKIAKKLKDTHGPKLKDFREALADAPKGKFPEIDALKEEVESFAAQFPTVGFEKKDGMYTQSL